MYTKFYLEKEEYYNCWRRCKMNNYSKIEIAKLEIREEAKKMSIIKHLTNTLRKADFLQYGFGQIRHEYL